jgi:pimeloyl-ACP methyl ester carboxylesterase/sugar lactone lactonase YvrE
MKRGLGTVLSTLALSLSSFVLAGPGETALERLEIPVGELTFDALAAGPEGGEVVILLHGFPQTSRVYRRPLGLLASLGYRAIAPDQRGYSPRARPAGVEAYGLGDLAADVVGIADAIGCKRFDLVGHDWGGAVAWAVASGYPDRVHSLTVLSTPHPRALGRALADPDGEQAERSSYFADFASDEAEQTFLADDAAYLRRILDSPGTEATDIDAYVEALGNESALRGALNWYRALVRRTGTPPVGLGTPVAVPTLYIWGSEDAAFGRGAAEATGDFVAGPYSFHALPGVGHWLVEDAAETVDRLLVAHLRDPRGAARVTTVKTDRPLPSNGRLGGISVAPDGALYVSNFGRTLWRVDPDGTATPVDRTLKGSSGNAVAADGTVYQASFLDGRIVRIRPDGEVETWVEGGLHGPVGLAIGAGGNLYVCNCRSDSIARVRPDRTVEPFAESPDFDCPNGIARDIDGSLVVVSFKNGHVVRLGPHGASERIATLPDGGNAHVAVTPDALYVTKIESNRIYRLARDGTYAPAAGTGEPGLKDGPAKQATLARPNGIAASADGTILWVNNLIGPWRGEEETEIVIRRIDLGGPD